MKDTRNRDHPITARFRPTRKDLAVLAARQQGVTESAAQPSVGHLETRRVDSPKRPRQITGDTNTAPLARASEDGVHPYQTQVVPRHRGRYPPATQAATGSAFFCVSGRSVTRRTRG